MQETTTGCLWWLEYEGKRMHTEVLYGNLLENVHMVHRGDGRIMLRWIFRRQAVRIRGQQYIRIMSMMDIDARSVDTSQFKTRQGSIIMQLIRLFRK